MSQVFCSHLFACDWFLALPSHQRADILLSGTSVVAAFTSHNRLNNRHTVSVWICSSRHLLNRSLWWSQTQAPSSTSQLTWFCSQFLYTATTKNINHLAYVHKNILQFPRYNMYANKSSTTDKWQSGLLIDWRIVSAAIEWTKERRSLWSWAFRYHSSSFPHIVNSSTNLRL